LTQADCSSRDNRLSLLSAYGLCSAGGDVDSGCMRLQVTQEYTRRALAQPKY